jgi:hypothetical protein
MVLTYFLVWESLQLGCVIQSPWAAFIYLRDVSFIFRDKVVKFFFRTEEAEKVSVNKERQKKGEKDHFYPTGKE